MNFEPEIAIAELLAVARGGDAPAFWRAVKPFVQVLVKIYTTDQTEWNAFRSQVKSACSAINVRELDALVKPAWEPNPELVDLAASRCELWHDADKTAFASYEVGNHKEHWRIDSTSFQEWLAFLSHSELGSAASVETLKSCINTLSGTAKFDGLQHCPYMRVAKTAEGYWLDIGDAAWRAILITATGWQVVAQPPVKFIRTKTTRALPVPVLGGSVDDLWRLVNIPEDERLLVIGWILECYRANTPYVVLEFTGEQGAAKSSTQRNVRRFIDPNLVDLRGRPKKTEDIFVAAANAHLLSFENLSGLSNDQSDALCVCATGGGYASRQFYTNGEESVLTAHCPVVLNGISPVVLRPDLLDRTISVSLPTIECRMMEDELQRQVDEAAPGIMGALLTLFAGALRLLPSVEIKAADLPRMADFAYLGEAIARVLGYSDGTFIDLYNHHRRTAVGRTIEASPVAGAMVDFLERGNTHRGTVKSLLELLNQNKPDREHEDFWPKSPKGLADIIRRYGPAFRQLGMIARVASDRRRDGIHCELAKADTEYACAGPKPGINVHNVHHVHTADVLEF
ncbi:MAG: hypothetical protein ACYCXT_08080 [Acidiferrobacteraceae bacterium]